MSFDLEMSFDAVIPSSILLNNNIELSAVKLFAFIKALTRIHGYCYASNKYLSSLMKGAERSVSRWISQLAKEGYIEIETNKEGMTWQRRIYISDEFKKVLRKDIHVYPPRHTCLPPTTPVSTILREEYKKEEKKKRESARGRAQPSPFFSDEIKESAKLSIKNFGSHVKLTQKEYEDLSLQSGGSDILNALIERMNLHIASHHNASFRKNPYNGKFAERLKEWIKADSKKPSKRTEKALKCIKSLKRYVDTNKINGIEFGPDYVEFVGMPDGAYKISEVAFEEKVMSALRKRDIPIIT